MKSKLIIASALSCMWVLPTSAPVYAQLNHSCASKPVIAQLSNPLSGTMAPEPLTFYRVALVSKQTFDKQDIAEAVAKELTDVSEVFKAKVIPSGNTFKIAMMLRIIFWDKKEAETAMEYLKQNPQAETDKYDIQVVIDHG